MEDYGRGNLVYDVGRLFDKEDPVEMTSEVWKGVLQAVLEAWSIAEAVSIHPDALTKMSSCSLLTDIM